MQALNSTKELIDDIRQGKMVVLMDDEDRENEGDLVMAATHITPDAINFMTHHARGLICLTLTEQRAKQINLPTMVKKNTANMSTNFTVSIEAAQGVTTGISAADRATTVQAAVAPHAKPEDLVQPGHIFPIIAKKGGVLARAGHTEAGCDLAQLAGLEPASVIVEILNKDGNMARRPDLQKFAQVHDLKIGTIADLIEYRFQHEKLIERIHSSQLKTHHGEFDCHIYQDSTTDLQHFVLVKGDIQPDQPCLVRVQMAVTLDALLTKPEGRRWYLAKALEQIAASDSGVLVLLGEPHQPDFIEQISYYQKENIAGSISNQFRTTGLGSQILADIGVRKMRLLASPRKLSGLSGFGLEVVEYVELED